MPSLQLLATLSMLPNLFHPKSRKFKLMLAFSLFLQCQVLFVQLMPSPMRQAFLIQIWHFLHPFMHPIMLLELALPSSPFQIVPFLLGVCHSH
jgi:hypothetical protein